MPVAAGIENLSTTAASNDPQGSEQRNLSDDYLRALSAFLRQTVTAGSDIASASTITPPSTGSSFNITGTTSITAIGSTNSWDGRIIWLRFAASLTLTNSANLVLPGGTNITTVAGDYAAFRQRSSGVWDCIAYRASNIRIVSDGTNQYFQGGVGTTIVGTTNAGSLIFTTNNTSQWLIDSSGRIQNTANTQPSCFLINSASRSTTGVFGTYTTTNHNYGSIANASTGVVTVPVAGRYLITFAATGATTSGTGIYEISPRRNSVLIGAALNVGIPASGLNTQSSAQFIAPLSASDTIDLNLSAISGSGAGVVITHFSVTLLG